MAKEVHSVMSERISLRGNAKGTVLLPAVKSLRFYPGGRESVPPPLKPYVEKRILAANWYPEEDYVALLAALAPVLERNRSQIGSWPAGVSVWEFIGRSAAEQYATGTYKSLFRQGDVQGSLKNFRSFWELRHDTGQTDLVISPEGTAAYLDIAGYAVVNKNHCKVIEGSIWGFLYHGGATADRISIRKSLCRADGDALCRWELGW
jgi:hypothetical protein